LFRLLLFVNNFFGNFLTGLWRSPRNTNQAKADAGQKDNFLMDKDFFAMSYNNSKGTPNWVSWRLLKTDLGTAPRFQFHPDEDLPPGFNQITPKDYTGGDFDRGHMCPHSDRGASDDMGCAKAGTTAPIEAVSPDDFFKDLVKEEKWHGQEEKALVQRYLKLKATVAEHLSNVQVFRVGKTKVDIFIVGKTKQGDWAGVKTLAVKT
jgi:hypothetical protein